MIWSHAFQLLSVFGTNIWRDVQNAKLEYTNMVDINEENLFS